jgi:hypothetical protein
MGGIGWPRSRTRMDGTSVAIRRSRANDRTIRVPRYSLLLPPITSENFYAPVREGP